MATHASPPRTQSDLWIGGEHVPPSSGRYFDDLNPLDDSLYSRVAEGTIEDMDAAVRNAEDAFRANRDGLARERDSLPVLVRSRVRALVLGSLDPGGGGRSGARVPRAVD